MTTTSSRAADVIVVGGGSAGCALAARLAENPDRRVLLLEAGRDYRTREAYPPSLSRGYSAASSLPGDPHAWTYLAELTDTVTYPVTRGRVLGGSSAVNGGQFTRGTALDFDGWAAQGHRLWSYEQVLPFFTRLENDLDLGGTPGHGDHGPIPVRRASEGELTPVARAFVEACLDRGHPFDPDMNAPDSIGIGITPHNVVHGIRRSTAEAYLAEDARPANLEVIELATARRLLLRGSRVVGVEVALDGQPVTFWADQVVLSAGGIGSPLLLMHSGIGPADVLSNAGVEVLHDLPGVGHGFMDHPAVHVTYRADAYVPRAGQLTASQVCLNYSSSLGLASLGAASLGAASLGSASLGSASLGSASLGSSSPGAPDDMRIFPTTYSKGGMLFGMRGQSLRERARAAAGVVRPLLAWQGLRGTSPRSLLHDVRHRGDLSLYCGLDLESSRGDLTLRSADPQDPPRIVSRYLSEPDDLVRMRECVRAAVGLLQSRQFRTLGARTTGLDARDVADDAHLDTWIQHHMSTAFHTSRTCRMGRSTDPFAVVDQHCRVHGIEGLRVVDISIMPTLVRRGPNATAVMIGERAAALMDLSLQPPDPPQPSDLRRHG